MKATTASAFKLLMEGSLSLARAEKEGIRVDVSYLKETHRKVVDQIATLTKELRNDPVWETWRKRFGEKSNLGSRPQLATVIFDCMGFPSLYQTEKGTRSSTALHHQLLQVGQTPEDQKYLPGRDYQ
jgi:DNA polymerase I-like protein with 3'-5' exonuclease and polymerase domains